MKAIVQDRYGDVDILELNDIDTPVVTDDAVLVRVHAAAVGKGDWLTVQGLPYVARLRYGLPNPKHPVPGFDVAGRIDAGCEVVYFTRTEEANRELPVAMANLMKYMQEQGMEVPAAPQPSP